MNNTDIPDGIESQVQAIWDASDRNSDFCEMPGELASILLAGIAHELTADEVGSLLALNRCSTLVELIERIGDVNIS